MPLGDIFDQAILTDVIFKSQMLDNTVPGQAATTGLGARIAPLRRVSSNAVRMRIVTDDEMGVGQFRAPEASYPLAHRNLRAREQFIELVQLAEKLRINEIMNMRSQDPRIQADALNSFISDTQWLVNRNALLTNWMRWKGIHDGSLTVKYPDGGSLTVDYGYDATHVVSASPLWSDTSGASIIDNLAAWTQLIVDDAGVTDFTFHMSTKIWRDYVMKNEEMLSYISALGRSRMIMTPEDVYTLTGFPNTAFVLYDEVYRDHTGTVNRFWPENKVLITGGTGYSVNGVRIAEMLDGVVPVSTRGNSVQFVTGPAVETYVDVESNTEMVRVASSRMLRINMPEAIVIATVAA